MLLRVSGFSGIAPRVSAKLLADNQAQVARNCRLQSGELRPFREPLEIEAEIITGAKTIHLLKDLWLSWATQVHAVPSPIADDTDYRLYYTGDGVPKKTWYALAGTGAGPYPGTNSRPLAVKSLAAAPTLAATTGSVPAGSYAYVATLINRFGPAGGGVLEESRPSPAALITLASAGGVTVTRGTLPTGSTAESWRLYRSTSAGIYQMVAEIAIATTSHTDALASPTSTVLPSNDWDEPPDDMEGLVAMPNGVMAGFRGNEILFSEPWYPHAWPIKYRTSISGEIRAIAVAGSALVVLTADTPWILTGSHPGSMTQERINIVSPCESKRSVVSDGYNVLYASRDGVAAISSSGQHQLVTRSLMDKEDWDKISPSTIVATSYYGDYLGIYEDSTVTPTKLRGLWLQTRDSPPLTEIDIDAVAAFGEYLFDSIGRLLKFDAHPTLKTLTEWRSKVFTLPRPANLAVMVVDADYRETALDYSDYVAMVQAMTASNEAAIEGDFAGEIGAGDFIGDVELSGSQIEVIPEFQTTHAVTVTLIADGVVRAVLPVYSRSAVRLPDGYKASDVEVVLGTSIPVYSVALASAASELRSVS